MRSAGRLGLRPIFFFCKSNNKKSGMRSKWPLVSGIFIIYNGEVMIRRRHWSSQPSLLACTGL
jgi:hypothetical protein